MTSPLSVVQNAVKSFQLPLSFFIANRVEDSVSRDSVKRAVILCLPTTERHIKSKFKNTTTATIKRIKKKSLPKVGDGMLKTKSVLPKTIGNGIKEIKSETLIAVAHGASPTMRKLATHGTAIVPEKSTPKAHTQPRTYSVNMLPKKGAVGGVASRLVIPITLIILFLYLAVAAMPQRILS